MSGDRPDPFARLALATPVAAVLRGVTPAGPGSRDRVPLVARPCYPPIMAAAWWGGSAVAGVSTAGTSAWLFRGEWLDCGPSVTTERG